jgi:hypothetical protein
MWSEAARWLALMWLMRCGLVFEQRQGRNRRLRVAMRTPEKSASHRTRPRFCSLLLNLLFATDAVISTSTDIDNRYVSIPYPPRARQDHNRHRFPSRRIDNTAPSNRARPPPKTKPLESPSTNTPRLQQSWVKESQEV